MVLLKEGSRTVATFELSTTEAVCASSSGSPGLLHYTVGRVGFGVDTAHPSENLLHVSSSTTDNCNGQDGEEKEVHGARVDYFDAEEYLDINDPGDGLPHQPNDCRISTELGSSADGLGDLVDAPSDDMTGNPPDGISDDQSSDWSDYLSDDLSDDPSDEKSGHLSDYLQDNLQDEESDSLSDGLIDDFLDKESGDVSDGLSDDLSHDLLDDPVYDWICSSETFSSPDTGKVALTKDTFQQLAERMYDNTCLTPQHDFPSLINKYVILFLVAALFVYAWMYYDLVMSSLDEDEPLIDL